MFFLANELKKTQMTTLDESQIMSGFVGGLSPIGDLGAVLLMSPDMPFPSQFVV